MALHRLRFCLRNIKDELQIDSVVVRDGEPVGPLPPDFVRWIEPGDIQLVPPDLRDLARQSDEYWRKRHEAVGLEYPVRA